MKEKLFTAYSWIVDAGIPMGKEKAHVLLEAAEELATLQRQLEESKAREARLREALEWYADEQTYESLVTIRPNNITVYQIEAIRADSGEKARQALAELDKAIPGEP